jgi:hypothetical protein
MGPYFSYSRIMRGAWAEGKPKRITGVGSWRLFGEEEGVELNNEGVISGGGEGATHIVSISIRRKEDVGIGIQMGCGRGSLHRGASLV